MGFSLEMFFEELRYVLAQDSEDTDKLARLERIIRDGYQYAKDCNRI